MVQKSGKLTSWYGKLLGGWTTPIEKYARQIGSFPQVGVKRNKFLTPPNKYPIIYDGFSYMPGG